ncbi:SDR family NAD(P)-dependent oxidoreductase [Bosea sp. (in: a-proteobacteria)]|uniref:SDR family NAD(P)-dependent oxidoreductase n=1 Tax=Bosea sp. (in: a-proteobacteria) TaxID=1871050 RepID=UPI002625E12A|nr:SDR family oxidoreductase [Bosea sp. (in: a-proteobacteria)]MCO5093374.1 SDR family oxidoreductase [Bosea sp. (in: a-proteobacteria)]
MAMAARMIVTGGAGGLGRAVAIGAAGRGARVAVIDIDAAGAEAVAETCGGIAIAADLIGGDPEAAVMSAAGRLGGLDVLVNNAGYGAGEAFLAMKAATWDRTLGLNVRALALASAAAGRIMAAQRAGRIINVTSPASRMALPNYTAYAASKAAVDAITRAAAVALAPHGIRVNSVAPGMMDTPMQRSTEEAFASLEGRSDIDAFLAERTARIPVGRRIAPEAVAEAVLWLAFDAPDYLTAERLNMSGGLDRD